MKKTRYEIECLNSGPEMDCLVAELVMGIKLYDNDQFSLGASGYMSRGHVPPYSTVIGEAIRVLTHCEMKLGQVVGLEFGTNRPTVAWVGHCLVSHKRVPHAICQAALRAVIALAEIPDEQPAPLPQA